MKIIKFEGIKNAPKLETQYTFCGCRDKFGHYTKLLIRDEDVKLVEFGPTWSWDVRNENEKTAEIGYGYIYTVICKNCGRSFPIKVTTEYRLEKAPIHVQGMFGLDI
jgi:hypothetical protein